MTDEEHTPASPEESPEEEPTPEAQAEPEKEPSAFGRVLRQALRWGVGIGVVFLLGVMVTWIVRVRPQADRVRELERSLDEARTEVESLRDDLEAMEELEQENESLRMELETKDHHLDLLAVLVDVTRARLELAQDNAGEAQVALEGTEERLRSLQAGLEGSEAETVSGMRDRLNLVLNELESDAFAAERDLEILSNNLVGLERSLFGEG